MPKIKVLSSDTIDKLRAGEVVERPASALKELVENSLDAGARRIEMEVKNGGKRLIRVSDDGEGMEAEDALLSLSRHATSKIYLFEDLLNVRTLGFRGEALPSIAAVSRLSLRSAPRGSREGLLIEAEGGVVSGSRPAPAEGTTVTVRDLYFNTPARRKFLRSDSTEAVNILSVATKEAIAHPETGFTLRMDGEEVLSLTPARDFRERLMQVYGAEFMEGLLYVEKAMGGLSLKAFFSKEGNSRGTRSHQFLYINGRAVREPALAHAVYTALPGLSAPDGRRRHPVFFIFLDISARTLDVNVHPRKEEVLLRERDLLYSFVHHAVKAAAAPQATGAVSARAPQNIPPGESFRPAAEGGKASEALPLTYEKISAGRTFIKIGEMFYAFVSNGSGLTILDHHAAHERVLYEKFLSGADLNPVKLLFPRQIRLAPEEKKTLLDNTALLSSMGIEIEDFGGEGSVILRGVPEGLFKGDFPALLSDAARELMDGGRGEEIKKKTAARLACHSSVRGQDDLTQAELESLMQALERTLDPAHCPHGRPTVLSFDMEGLKRLFKRK